MENDSLKFTVLKWMIRVTVMAIAFLSVLYIAATVGWN
ncbi:MAG: hypothetical protein JWR61_3579 [Ferruginibacter sp.]|nr:hypothetical protein [Ferruginibacter sp.]